MEQGPSTMRGLNTTQIIADLLFEFGCVRLTEILSKQDILSRNSRIGFKFENPVPILALLTFQFIGRAVNITVDIAQGSFGDHMWFTGTACGQEQASTPPLQNG